MNKALNTVAVDLTPILPGGENGGAKIFVLELLRRLAASAPKVRFVLLTQAASHDELATLDRHNMRRLMVVGPTMTNAFREKLQCLAVALLPRFPTRVRSVLSKLGYHVNSALKRSASRTLLRSIEADLLFCPFTAPTYFEAGIPTVCTIYDLQYKTYPEFFSTEDFGHRERTFIDACRRATALAAISEYSRDSAISHGRLDSARIRTIYLRMSRRIEVSEEVDNGVLNRLGLVQHRYLLYPANFWRHKNHEMLFTALGIACQTGLGANIKLVCTGAPGTRQEWLMRAARIMNLRDRIVLPGYLPDTELAVLLANCAGVIFPSLYEGFGLPVIEAMAAGVPVACSNSTSLPEIAGDAAILFDPRIPTQIAQAMILLTRRGSGQDRRIRIGAERAADFSDPNRMAREYWDLFQYALANENHANLLTGVFPDGWAGPRLSIQVAPATTVRRLEIEFFAPKWLPRSRITAKATRRGTRHGNPLVFEAGTTATFSLPMELAGGYYEVSIVPTFVPARTGHGDDHRELSAKLRRCGIVGSNGEYIELFAEKAS